MKILFEKLKGNEILQNWTTLFNNSTELLEFMSRNREHLVGDTNYMIRIREVK